MSSIRRWAGREREVLVAQGLWRELKRPPEPGAVVNLSSNDYLGLSRDNRLLEALRESAARHPLGATASRLLVGTVSAHTTAEACLAEFVGLPRSLLLSSGYAANIGVIPALAEAGDGILSDSLNHASLIDGCRLSRARTAVFRHGDLDHLRSMLEAQRSSFRHCWILTEAVFSMDGDEADLSALRQIADEYEAWLYVDEAHSLGVLGPRGAGLAAASKVVPEVLIGTLGKSFGMAGAFVAGGDETISLLVNRARSFVYSTGVLPALAGAIPAAVRLVEISDDAREQVQRHAQTIRRVVRGGQPATRSAIVPVPIGCPNRALDVSSKLLDMGFLAQAIRPPTVPIGTSRLRCVPISTHEDQEITDFVASLTEAMAT